MADKPESENGKDESAPETVTKDATEEGKTPLPIVLSTQRIGVPTPQTAEEIRAVLEAHESDACIRDKATGGWIYIRQRAMLNLEALKANEKSQLDRRGPVDTSNNDGTPEIVGPDSNPISADNPRDHN